MLLPADAVPRETRRRTTLRRDRRRKNEKEIEFEGEGGRGQVGSERDERSGTEGWRKWNGEKARHEARYFPHGERSLFTSPLSKSAPTGALAKKFRFSCAVTPSRARARARTLRTSRCRLLEETCFRETTISEKIFIIFSNVLQNSSQIRSDRSRTHSPY